MQFIRSSLSMRLVVLKPECGRTNMTTSATFRLSCDWLLGHVMNAHWLVHHMLLRVINFTLHRENRGNQWHSLECLSS